MAGCKNAAILGGTVCAYHGGRAPAVNRRARQRLEEGADRMARELLKSQSIKTCQKRCASTQKDALDRAGVQARSAVDVSILSAPHEQVFA